MDISRRPFLKGLAASSLAISAARNPAEKARSLIGSPISACDDLLPITAIVAGSSYDDLFLFGVEAAARSQLAKLTAILRFNGIDIDALKKLRIVFTPKQHSIVIGLTDDGSAAIIVESARAAGAKMLWLGHHRLNVGETSSHRILTAASATGLTVRFAEQLNDCGERFCITEQCFSDAREISRVSAESRAAAGQAATSGAWVSALGMLLVSANTTGQALGQGPSPFGNTSQPGGAPPSRFPGNFASFVFQL